MESDTDSKVDIRQSGVVASNYLPEAISTDEDTNVQVGNADNTEMNSEQGMLCFNKCNILFK